MSKLTRGWGLVMAGLFLMTFFVAGAAAQVNPGLYAGLRWRDIGPHHGGRIASVSGAVGEPGVFYAGLPQGGMEKTTSAGVTWHFIFDQERQVDSVGAVQVAPSDANIIYAGTGDSVGGSEGDGMYKSSDGGRTWSHAGLEDTVKINTILVSPGDPNLLLASTQGDATHSGRGVFRSTDGGASWTNVLNPSGYNGTRDIAYAFDDASVVFATAQGNEGFRFGRRPAGAAAPVPAALYKSSDSGQTWTKISSLPDFPGRIGVAVAMHTQAQRVYVIGNSIHGGSGLVRSDDGGQTWRQMDAGDRRISNGQGSYSCGVYVNPANPDIVYTVATALYRSLDGGHSFAAFKGAPGGEDMHPMWLDPSNGQRMIIGTDQGASVTLDGGRTWSTYYNQPVAQIYHIDTTDQYPFWVVASQQDTAAVMMRNRSHFGEVNIDWRSLPSAEYGRLAADPLHPEIIYGVEGSVPGGGSGVQKVNAVTGQWENVAPDFGAGASRYRESRDSARHFDTAFDAHALYVAFQCLMVTRDGGQSWQAASPDLTEAKGQPLRTCGAAGDTGRAAIADFSISTAKPGVFWTVSTNAEIYDSHDGGKTWANESNVPDAAGVGFGNIQAGHQDAQTAYISGRLGGMRGAAVGVAAGSDTNVPLIWRTHDGGRTWTKIVQGLPRDQRTGSWVNVVREDPEQAGLLYCGTESAVYVSFDDGNHWQPLQQNMPTTSVRDLKIHSFDHENDLVAATYGRGVWVLDDISPLREIATSAADIAGAPAYLFTPAEAIRSRENVQWDQPVQREENHAPNPPYGAIIYYHLSRTPSGPVTLKVYDAAGNLVRTLTSTPPAPTTGAPFPSYWLATPASRALPTAVGTNRTHWNLRYDPPPAFEHDIENETEFAEGEVVPSPIGPQVIPGTYTLRLTVDGSTYSRSLTVINDPRIGQSAAMMAALRAQNRLNRLAYQGMEASYAGGQQAAALAREVEGVAGNAQAPQAVQAEAKRVEVAVKAIAGGSAPAGFFRRRPAAGGMQSFRAINTGFSDLIYQTMVGYDMAPTQAMEETGRADCASYSRTLTAWKALQSHELVALNRVLTENHLAVVEVGGDPQAPGCE
ncbi:MAG: hypothetical protein ACRD1C_13945 [Terriglobales bacterium]